MAGITVAGYSGCGIVVRPGDPSDARDGGCRYVLEKASSGPGYNPRLAKQLDKQDAYAHRLAALNKPRHSRHPSGSPASPASPAVVDDTTRAHRRAAAAAALGIKVPPVLFREERIVTRHAVNAAGHKKVAQEMLLVTGMKFEHHTDAITFLCKATVPEIHAFTDALVRIVSLHVELSPLRAVPVKIFTDKLTDIGKQVRKNAILAPHHDRVGDMLVRLSRWITGQCGVNGALGLPIGCCHGDLTLSNVLIQRSTNVTSSRAVAHCDPAPEGDAAATGEEATAAAAAAPSEALQLVLIDFLDSFVESPLADLAKLSQELVYGWTLREAPPTVDRTRIFLIYADISRHIEASCGELAWYRDFYRFFLVVNQLRVLQYTSSDADGAYLLATIDAEFAKWAGANEATPPPAAPPGLVRM